MKIVYPRIVTRSKRSQNSDISASIENEGIELQIADDSSSDQG